MKKYKYLIASAFLIILMILIFIPRPSEKIYVLYDKNEIKKVAISTEQLQKFVGAYELQPEFIIEIERQNDRLYGKAAGQPTLELTPETENSFLLAEIEAQIVFNFNNEGTVKSLTFSQGGMKMEGKKIK